MNISDEAVKAAAKYLGDLQADPDGVYTMEARDLLRAAAPHLMAGMEWGVFRVSDNEPRDHLRYKSREAAQRSIDYATIAPDLWEVRGRAVSNWSAGAGE